MPRHTTEKAHLELTDCGPFWQDFCAPHSQLFAQTQTGGTKREVLAKPWGRYSSIWRQCLPPACFCWAVLNEVPWVRVGLGKSGPLGARRNGPLPTSLWNILVTFSPQQMPQRAQVSYMASHLCAHAPESSLWQQHISFLTFVPSVSTPTPRNLLS